MKHQLKQNGFLAIVAVVIIIIFGFIGVIATYLVNTDVLEGVNDLSATQALYIADAGLNAGQHSLLNTAFSSRIACSAVTGNVSLTADTFTGAKGPFTVTGTGPQSPSTASTLNGALTAAATTIPLVSVANYASSGRIMIDKELINYVGTSGNNLLNATRGVDGTTATTHVSGVPVGQYQCTLTSVGSVPSVNPSGSIVGGQRTLQEVVQLPEAWAVGNSASLSAKFMHWNKPTELMWSDATIASLNRDFDSVFMLSNADVWAVGQAGNIRHWTGGSWIASTSGTANGLLSVYCLAGNYCWAVGSSRTFDFWNGSVWTVQPTAGIPNVQYNGVFCITSTDCWAVGNPSGGDVMMHWNGTAWSRDASRPTPAAALRSVVCTSTSNCWAVGDGRTFILWNGVSWATVSVTTLPNVGYNSVTCVTSSDCWAAGNNSGGSVTVHWNGSVWSRVAAPTSVNLNGVGCYATNDCWAVGNSGTALHWDGTAWTSFAAPFSVTLNSVSLISPRSHPTAAWQEVFP